MARVPISFYLNVFAGVIVLFNHYAVSETGDAALNKVTGAAGRFYTVLRDTTLQFQYGCTSSLETALCGPAMDNILPHDAVTYLREHYCHLSVQDTGSEGEASMKKKPHGRYGGSGFALAYYQQPPMQPLVPQTSTESTVSCLPVSLSLARQPRLSRAVWVRSSEVMTTIGTLLLRTCVSWWWFQAPLKVTRVLLGTCATLSALLYVFDASAVRWIVQVYVELVTDFLRCIEWEAQRQVLDMAVVAVEHIYGFVTYTHEH